MALPGIEPGSGASETLILSIVLQGLLNVQMKIYADVQMKKTDLHIRTFTYLHIYLINPCAFVANIFTAMAIKITPKNFLTAMRPAGPKMLSINLNDLSTA